MLDFLLTSVSELISDNRIGSCLGYSDCTKVEFMHLKDTKQIETKIRALSLKKAQLQLLRVLVNKKPLGDSPQG